MIISASRRTDIPCFYADWFCNRLREGFVLVRNPVNAHQVSRVALAPDVVDGIVLWSKNPKPMLGKLHLLAPYPFYFQFTLTAYGPDVEPHLPPKESELAGTFRALAEKTGPERVVWRYDPILTSPAYPPEFHVAAFGRLAERLRGYTKKCTISFLDFYPKIQKRLAAAGICDMPDGEKRALAAALSRIAAENGMHMDACAEEIDLRGCGVAPARCVDGRLLSAQSGVPLRTGKDKTQRPACGCDESIDVGQYGTCTNGCLYCYANNSPAAARQNAARHIPASPLLCGFPEAGDSVTERQMQSLAAAQCSLFDAAQPVPGQNGK